MNIQNPNQNDKAVKDWIAATMPIVAQLMQTKVSLRAQITPVEQQTFSQGLKTQPFTSLLEGYNANTLQPHVILALLFNQGLTPEQGARAFVLGFIALTDEIDRRMPVPK